MRIFSFWQRAKKRPDELTQRVSTLEREIEELKRLCREQLPGTPPVVVEKLCVERICVERLEFTNNLGALGIKELSGSLNIGANYGVPPGKKAGWPPSSGKVNPSPATPGSGASTSAPDTGKGAVFPAGQRAARQPPGFNRSPPAAAGREKAPSRPAAANTARQYEDGSKNCPPGAGKVACPGQETAAAPEGGIKINFKRGESR